LPRYGVRGTHSCFANFTEALTQFGLDRSYNVGNVNFFMSLPVGTDGEAVNVQGHSKAGSYVDLRAERDVGDIVELPADAQSLQHLKADPDPGDRLAAGIERQNPA
jgi:uncharacterized protein YcgI (DUF1989 family)